MSVFFSHLRDSGPTHACYVVRGPPLPLPQTEADAGLINLSNLVASEAGLAQPMLNQDSAGLSPNTKTANPRS